MHREFLQNCHIVSDRVGHPDVVHDAGRGAGSQERRGCEHGQGVDIGRPLGHEIVDVVAPSRHDGVDAGEDIGADSTDVVREARVVSQERL